MEPIFFGIIKGEQPLVCNGDDRGQWPKQGGAVGAVASRMQGPLKGRSSRWVPQLVQSTAEAISNRFLPQNPCKNDGKCNVSTKLRE